MTRDDKTENSNAPVFLPTIQDRLAFCSNDYSFLEAEFQTGRYLSLVDTFRHERGSDQNAIEYQRTHAAFTKRFLRGEEYALNVSVIIPIHGGARMLSQCLLSVARQSFAKERPSHIEVIIVEDGIPSESSSVFEDIEVDQSLQLLAERRIVVKPLRLLLNQGRSQARNAGIQFADGELMIFVDGSMVLDEDFLLEQVWRHARLRQNFALLGFKENIALSNYEDQKADIISGWKRADYKSDLKWHHILLSDEASPNGFQYGRRRFKGGDPINYMHVTRWLKKLNGTTQIGNRSLPSFFQTNIVSTYKKSVIDVGGFEPNLQLWGLEDTFLGALLVANGCLLVPCPSSVAFNLELDETENPHKPTDLSLNKAYYSELLSRTRLEEYTPHKFQRAIQLLNGKISIVEKSYLTSSPMPSKLEHEALREPVASLTTDSSEQLLVGNLNTLSARGWDSSKVVEAIAELDYATMEGLTPAAAGSPSQWMAVFNDHPDSWRVLISSKHTVVGYWHFVSLFNEDFERAVKGELLDQEISAERVNSFELPGVYNIYFAGMAIHPAFRSHTALNLLISSFFQVLSSLAENNIFFEQLVTNAFTSYGMSICETLNFTPRGSAAGGGIIYTTTVPQLLTRPLARGFESLLGLYESQLNN